MITYRYWGTGRFNVFCTPPTTEQPDLDIPGDTEYFAFFSVVYFYVRIIDLLDTVMFVLSKKLSHVTFLHVYHHVIVITTGEPH